MSRPILLFIFIIACQNQNDILESEGDKSFLLNVDSLFSQPIQKTLNAFSILDDEPPLKNRIYSVYLKNFVNTSTVFVHREYFIDSVYAKFADAFCLINDNLFIVYNGGKNIRDAFKSTTVIGDLHNIGFSTTWNGIVRHMPGYMLHVFRGEIDKIDSTVSTDTNILYQEGEFNLVPPKK